MGEIAKNEKKIRKRIDGIGFNTQRRISLILSHVITIMTDHLRAYWGYLQTINKTVVLRYVP